MPKPHLVITPFTLKDEGPDKELADITATIEASMPQPARHFWHEVFDVEEWRLLSGLSLGLGLAFVSIALNGLTDHLLFNIPSSMFFWLLAALAADVSLMQEEPEKVEEEEAKEEAGEEKPQVIYEVRLDDAAEEKAQEAEAPAEEPETEEIKQEETKKEGPEKEDTEEKETEGEKSEEEEIEAKLEEKLALFEKMKKPEDRKEGEDRHEEGKD